MTPERWKLMRDAIIVFIGGVLLLHEGLVSSEPNSLIVGAGLALLGVPPVLRLDERRDK